MRLTRFTDYAMRSLFYMACKPDQLVTVGQIAKTYNISQNHLVKVVQDLVKHGYVTSVKGRGGGMRLAKSPDELNLGQIVRNFEPDMKLIDCVGCQIHGDCTLPGPLHKAIGAFVRVLDEYTLADIVRGSPGMPALFDKAIL